VASSFGLPELAPLPEIHRELGRVLSRHHGKALAGGTILYVGALLVLAGVVQLFHGVADLVSGGGGLDELAMAFAAFLGAGLILLRCLYLWRQSLGIYEHGFTIQRLFGTRVIRWDEIESATAVRRSDSLGHHFDIEVELRRGGGVTLTDALSDIESQAQLFQTCGGYRG
jgi:hypothetical protein